jgi:cytidine deaminase
MSDPARDALIERAREAARGAYAPYSGFHVGAALLFADGSVVTGANVENASYGLSLCAETVAVAKVLGASGKPAALAAVAVTGGAIDADGKWTVAASAVTPCGRCRQVLNELAQLGGSDPLVWCDGGAGGVDSRLSILLPHAFGPGNLA